MSSVTKSVSLPGPTLSDLEVAWGAPVPEEERALWLSFNPRKRELAIQRLEAVREFASLAEPSIDQVTTIADGIGLKRSRFYLLIKAWEATRSLRAIVPHAEPRVGRLPRARSTPEIDAAVNGLMLKSIETGLRKDPSLSAYAAWQTIVSHCEKEGLPAPSKSTVGRWLERIARSVPGNLRSREALLSSVDPRSPDAFGSLLVIDHTAVDLWPARSGNARPAVATLIVDQHSRLILGGALGDLPDFHGIYEAADNAIATLHTLDLRSLVLSGLTPAYRCVLGSGSRETWEQLVGQLVAREFVLVAGGTARYGRDLRRLIGPTIGSVRILRSLSEVGTKSLVRSSEAHRVTFAGVAEGEALLRHMIQVHNREQIFRNGPPIIPSRVSVAEAEAVLTTSLSSLRHAAKLLAKRRGL